MEPADEGPVEMSPADEMEGAAEPDSAGDEALPVSKSESYPSFSETFTAEEAEEAIGPVPEDEAALPVDPDQASVPAQAKAVPDEEEHEAVEEEEMVEAPVLLDVLGQTVGIAHFGGHFIPIIKRFSKLPAKASQVFTTCMDDQSRIRIVVLQGEGNYIKENTPLGEFILDGIEQARRGIPEVEVSFEIDQSGLFMVSAKDLKTGSEKSITLEDWTGGQADEDRGQVLS
jgi:molecular chaperone DnaK (HSP70)